MASYRVLEYGIDVLVENLAEFSKASKEDIDAKIHSIYFRDYFLSLGAKTLLIEPEYIDHDYLEDYAAYYVRCFEPYKRTTARFHFFELKFAEEEIKALITGNVSTLTTEALSDSYLGFVVVKPLPQTIIGRTCLRTYPSDGGRRCFPILRKYDVNLFGIDLSVESLAYQEQDTVVAACATSAVWSCFQGTGKLFQHSIPSPVEITKAATVHIPENLSSNESRSLPNKGLTAKQMAHAIRSVNLEPYIVGTPNDHVLNSTAYGYLRGKIPSILAVQMFDVVPTARKHLGGHAVAVTGYSLGRGAPKPFGPSGFLLRASRIDKIYAHDDQIGPFSRMVHAGTYLATTWRGNGNVEAIPELLILPLYHKIRIPYSVVHDAVLEVDALLEIIRLQAYPALMRPEWDIYLTSANEFKNDVFRSFKGLLGNEGLLTKNLPRFLWRATAFCDQDRQLDLIFDATGIEQSALLVGVIEIGAELPAMLCGLTNYVLPAVKSLQARAIFEYFKP